MKIQLIIIALAISTQFGIAQKVIQPTIGMSVYGNMLDSDGVITKTIIVSPGFQFRDRGNLSFDIGYVISDNKNNCFFNNKKLNGFMTSVSFDYRLINTRSKISPTIGFSAGTGMFTKSKVKNRISESQFKNVPEDEQEFDYDSYRFFVKGKFMLDIRLKKFSLNFGPTYNLYEARRFVMTEQKFNSSLLNGVGLELGVTIPISLQPFSLREYTMATN